MLKSFEHSANVVELFCAKKRNVARYRDKPLRIWENDYRILEEVTSNVQRRWISEVMELVDGNVLLPGLVTSRTYLGGCGWKLD